jgi:hypothetical protein
MCTGNLEAGRQDKWMGQQPEAFRGLRVERVEYRGWKNAYRFSNGLISLIVLADVGPRIAFFGFTDCDNEFYENPEQVGMCGGDEFRVYGGHRLWVSPELKRTYYPDNLPVKIVDSDGTFVFTAPPEDKHPGEGLQKEVEIAMDSREPHVEIRHRIRNLSGKSVEMAPWAITVMAAGGKAILPLSPRVPFSPESLLPVGNIAVWSYTDLADPRWKIGTKYLQLRQESNPNYRFQEQMLGIYSPLGWAAYYRKGNLFVKKASVIKNGIYPDLGCNLEVFTDAHSLELETLAPVRLLHAGEEAEHREDWWLFRGLPSGEDDAWADEVVLKAIATARPPVLA